MEVKAKNGISKTLKKSVKIHVEDASNKNDKGSLECDLGQELGKTIKCYGEIDRGSNLQIPIDFGDGIKENLTLSKTYIM